MSIYSIVTRTTNVTSNLASMELIAGAGVGYRLLELGFICVGGAGGAHACGLGRPAAKGITPTTPLTLIAEDFNNTTASTVTTAVAWGTGPTVPTNFLRRWSFNAASGSDAVFSPFFGRTINVLKTNSLVYWSIVTSAGIFQDVWVVVDE